MTTTVIRQADWVVAWEEGAGRHVYRRNLDIAFSGDRIVFVGRNYGGAADEVVDGKYRLVMPGLIDIHSHPAHEPLYRGGPGRTRLAQHAHDRTLRALAGIFRTRR